MKTLNMKKFKDLNPCKDGYEYVLSLKTKDLKTIFDALKTHNIDWANWLVVRLMKRKDCLRYVLFAVKSCQANYETKHPESTAIKDAIAVIESVIKNDTRKNRDAASYAARDAWYAARDASSYAARYAADAARYAADAADVAMRNAALLVSVEYGISLLVGQK